MIAAAEAGADWASRDRYAFAKDFGGNYLCVEEDGGVVRIEEGEVRALADSVEHFLEELTDELESGTLTIADPEEPRARRVETFEVVFDAARTRTPGEPVKNSAFLELGIEATVESLDEHGSPGDQEPYRYGFAVRMVPRDANVTLGDIGQMKLTDDRGRGLRERCEQGQGGGKPGFYVLVASKSQPLPPGSRLRIQLRRTTRA